MTAIGLVGLGRMGAGLAARWRAAGFDVHGVDRDAARAAAVAAATGLRPAASLAELVERLPAPRVVWVMVPAGAPTEAVLDELGERLAPGDVAIDGGNSDWRQTVARAARFAERGLTLVDAGTSGGVWGEREGYCLMIGGPEDAVARLAPVFAALAAPEGWAHVGPSGAGHYVKMVHNAVEYVLLQGYAEGMELLRAAPWPLPVGRVAELWRHGSVVRSWLLDLLAAALAREGDELAHLRGWVEDSGEGRWALETAVAHAVPTPALAAALFARFRSRQEDPYGAKILALLRHEFGGHAVRREPDAETP